MTFLRRLFSSVIFATSLIAFLIFIIFFLVDSGTTILSNLEIQTLDLHFNLKQSTTQIQRKGGGVEQQQSHKISRDIVLIGIENTTLDAFGRWPFPRSHHADLLNSFTRISNQTQRESAILLDILFNDIAERPFEDVLLLEAIKESGNVFLQTQLFTQLPEPERAQEYARRLEILLQQYGEIFHVKGDREMIPSYYSVESPLIPYGKTIQGYGHASYRQDSDRTYRRQQLIARYKERVGEYRLENLKPNMDFEADDSMSLSWVDFSGNHVNVPLPLTEISLTTLRKEMENSSVARLEINPDTGETNAEDYYVTLYQDHFIPAITLALALQYFHKTLDDIEVVFGSHLLIPAPERWDPSAEQWIPYKVATRKGGRRSVDEIRIPIDNEGNMLINFMGKRSSPERGGEQTYPLRSYASQALRAPGLDQSTWPTSKGFSGKVLMAGAFSLGMADDEKTTPLGLMFGVEIHANALNTILMDNFILAIPSWMNSLILFSSVFLFAFITAKLRHLGWAIALLCLFIASSFLTVSLIFEFRNYLIDWSSPILATTLTFVAVMVYRVLSAEREKRNITNVFGQFVSPAIVEELAKTPPSLGGEDIDTSIFFSDIRGFSGMSEKMTPQELVSLLNEYLTDMTNTLVDVWEGTLDKYIGDAIMAFWGAPRIQENHAVLACKCAIEQIRILEKLNEKWEKESTEEGNAQHIAIGIGINSGICTVGYMGSEGRKNYTAMGDTVNLASRLEGINKQYRTQIIISKSTKEKIEHESFILRELDDIRVKGKNEPVTIYEVIDYEGSLSTSSKKVE